MKKYLRHFLSLAVIGAIGFAVFTGISMKMESSESKQAEFVPHDWSVKGAVPLPLLGAVDVSTTNKYDLEVKPTESPVSFDSSAALERKTWKVIVINQYRARAQRTYEQDDRLLRWMAQLKSSLTGVGVPTEIWFMRLNRPYMKNQWADRPMLSRCGDDGSKCFDRYLVLAQSSLDYSLERDYLSSLRDGCPVNEYELAYGVVVVDGEGQLRHAYTPCYMPISLKSMLLNFEHHAEAKIDGLELAVGGSSTPYLSGFTLKPSVKDGIKLSGQNLVQQVTEFAEDKAAKASRKYDDAVEQWSK